MFVKFISAFSLVFVATVPGLAQEFYGKRCFATDSRVCIFRNSSGNFGLDLSNAYSQQQLLAEIALKYAQIGNFKESSQIVETLLIESLRSSTVSEIKSLSKQDGLPPLLLKEVSRSKVKRLSDAFQAILDKSNHDKNNQLVRLAIEMTELGLFEDADEVLLAIERDEPYQALVLVHMANVYIQTGQVDIAQKKLSKAMNVVLSLECNVHPCSNAQEDRILNKILLFKKETF